MAGGYRAHRKPPRPVWPFYLYPNSPSLLILSCRRLRRNQEITMGVILNVSEESQSINRLHKVRSFGFASG
jgi:hypothetical protein